MSAPFRVLHLTSSKNRSGGTRQAVLLAQGQQADGVEVCLATVKGAGALEMAEHAGVATVCVPCEGWRSLWQDSRYLRRVVAWLGADLVHTHHTRAHDLALMATVGGGFPPLVVNRGVLFRPRLPAKFRLARNAVFTTNSEAVKRVLIGCGVREEIVHVIHNAAPEIDPATVMRRAGGVARELQVDREGPVIGAVGRGRPEKGFQVLVAAAPRILEHFPGATFVLVGSGTEHLWSPIRALGLQARFRLPGQRRDALDLMGMFDLFVVPSLDMDSCPNVLLEAMGLGIPAVGSTVGGIPEIMDDGAAGRLVAPGRADELATAVVELLRRPAEAKQMGARGRQRMLKAYTLDAKVRQTLAVYESVTGKATVTAEERRAVALS